MRRLAVYPLAALLLLAVPPALAAPEKEHVVKEGETLGGIANRNGVSASALAKANALKEPYNVRVGQKLVLPGSGKAPARDNDRTGDRDRASGSAIPVSVSEYVVKEGETLGGIAYRADVARIVIIEANGLTEPYDVRAGQKLLIPRQRTHVVKPGETGFDIAYKYGIAFDKIAVANGLDPGAKVKAGQKLVIPALTRAEDKPPAYKGGPAPVAPPVPEPPAARFRWPIVGSINQGFNSLEAGKGHNGVDIAAEAGEPVKAAAGGIVIYAEFEKSRFGNLVIIQHDDRWHTAYGHLATITTKKGASVKSGEVIGTAGSTGIATTTEVHFEIRHANKPIDPVDLLGQPK